MTVKNFFGVPRNVRKTNGLSPLCYSTKHIYICNAMTRNRTPYMVARTKKLVLLGSSIDRLASLFFSPLIFKSNIHETL